MESSTDNILSSTDTVPSPGASDNMEDSYHDLYRPEEQKVPPAPSIKDYKEHPIGMAKVQAQRKMSQLKHLGKIVECHYEKRARKVRQFIQDRMGSMDDADIGTDGTTQVGQHRYG